MLWTTEQPDRWFLGVWSTSSPASATHRFAASDFLPIVKEKSEAGRQPRRGARVREATLSPHPIAYCACGRAGLRQARAAFGGRFARLDSGHPTEAWLRIGFRDEWGLTVFPKSGTRRSADVDVERPSFIQPDRSADRTSSVAAAGRRSAQAVGLQHRAGRGRASGRVDGGRRTGNGSSHRAGWQYGPSDRLSRAVGHARRSA